MEPADVYRDRVHSGGRIVLIDHLDAFEKVVFLLQACQRIVLSCMDHIDTLKQLYRMVDPGEDHLRNIKRLRNEVCSAHIERFGFSFLFGCEHDDRNALELVVFLEYPDKLITVDLGHLQVKKYQRKCMAVSSDQIERFFTVGCMENFVFFRNDILQGISVGNFAVNNQNTPFKIQPVF